METRPLPDPAEEIRKQIKALLSPATVVHEDDSGNKKYGGDALSELISRIKIELNIDEVRTVRESSCSFVGGIDGMFNKL